MWRRIKQFFCKHRSRTTTSHKEVWPLAPILNPKGIEVKVSKTICDDCGKNVTGRPLFK